MKVVRVFLVVGVLMALASCSLKGSWDLAGKWEKVDGHETVEFLRNGTMNMVSGPISLSAPYRLTDAHHAEIKVGGLGAFSLKFAVVKDSLTLTDASGQVTAYKKVK